MQYNCANKKNLSLLQLIGKALEILAQKWTHLEISIRPKQIFDKGLEATS